MSCDPKAMNVDHKQNQGGKARGTLVGARIKIKTVFPSVRISIMKITNVSRALQNDLDENIQLVLGWSKIFIKMHLWWECRAELVCVPTARALRNACTKFQLEILIRSKISDTITHIDFERVFWKGETRETLFVKHPPGARIKIWGQCKTVFPSVMIMDFHHMPKMFKRSINTVWAHQLKTYNENSCLVHINIFC